MIEIPVFGLQRTLASLFIKSLSSHVPIVNTLITRIELYDKAHIHKLHSLSNLQSGISANFFEPLMFYLARNKHLSNSVFFQLELFSVWLSYAYEIMTVTSSLTSMHLSISGIN